MQKLILYCSFLILTACAATGKHCVDSDAFVQTMVEQHGFNKTALQTLLKQAAVNEQVLTKIAKPAESLPWHLYKKLLITPERIHQGVLFWQTHEKVLTAVERDYGIPAQIIVAIIGIETHYGQHTGKYRVLDALSSLAFFYPPRSEFFSHELAEFLLLCREENINPLLPTGSYAGAMGIPQFMPSSYRSYALDFNKDTKRDIWQNPDDAIASVANYLRSYHWQTGDLIAMKTQSPNETYQTLLTEDLKPNTTVLQLKIQQINLDNIADNAPVKLVELALDTKPAELWATFTNFYVITRYNHSSLYAMAVYQLSEAIKTASVH